MKKGGEPLTVCALGACAAPILKGAALTALGVTGVAALNKRKKSKKKKKGGGGYPMDAISGYGSEEEEEFSKLPPYELEILENNMRRDCSNLMRYIIDTRDRTTKEYYANRLFYKKNACLKNIKDFKNDFNGECIYCKNKLEELKKKDELGELKRSGGSSRSARRSSRRRSARRRSTRRQSTRRQSARRRSARRRSTRRQSARRRSARSSKKSITGGANFERGEIVSWKKTDGKRKDMIFIRRVGNDVVLKNPYKKGPGSTIQVHSRKIKKKITKSPNKVRKLNTSMSNNKKRQKRNRERLVRKKRDIATTTTTEELPDFSPTYAPGSPPVTTQTPDEVSDLLGKMKV